MIGVVNSELGIQYHTPTIEYSSNTSLVAQVEAGTIDEPFYLWCTWEEWRMLDCPKTTNRMDQDDNSPGTPLFALLLLRYFNDQLIIDNKKRMIVDEIKKLGVSIDNLQKFKSLWRKVLEL